MTLKAFAAAVAFLCCAVLIPTQDARAQIDWKPDRTVEIVVGTPISTEIGRAHV